MSRITHELCPIEGCIGRIHSRGLCSPHAMRLRKYGDPKLGGPIKRKDRRTKDPLYGLWINMAQRCNNPKNPRYKHYGGRGIKVCERWRSDFLNFKDDIGTRPSPLHQLDRIDNDGDYCPENCRWATSSLNAYNRPSSRPAASGYKGVNRRKTGWVAYAKYQGNKIYIGYYKSGEEAAWMADQYNISLWGDNARLNFDYE